MMRQSLIPSGRQERCVLPRLFALLAWYGRHSLTLARQAQSRVESEKK